MTPVSKANANEPMQLAETRYTARKRPSLRPIFARQPAHDYSVRKFAGYILDTSIDHLYSHQSYKYKHISYELNKVTRGVAPNERNAGPLVSRVGGWQWMV